MGESWNMPTVYIAGFIAVFVLVLIVAMLVSRQTALLFSPLIILPLAIWGMIQWRCKISGGFECGWMSFGGGVTWHFWASAGIVMMVLGCTSWAIARVRRSRWIDELRELTFASRALVGLWVYAIWVALPIAIIHPPSHGGPCPNIPLVCHDIPLLGLGGGFWLAVPFILVAGISFSKCTIRRLTTSSGTYHAGM